LNGSGQFSLVTSTPFLSDPQCIEIGALHIRNPRLVEMLFPLGHMDAPGPPVQRREGEPDFLIRVGDLD
jgi:hypothetical protein